MQRSKPNLNAPENLGELIWYAPKNIWEGMKTAGNEAYLDIQAVLNPIAVYISPKQGDVEQPGSTDETRKGSGVTVLKPEGEHLTATGASTPEAEEGSTAVIDDISIVGGKGIINVAKAVAKSVENYNETGSDNLPENDTVFTCSDCDRSYSRDSSGVMVSSEPNPAKTQGTIKYMQHK